MFLLWHPFGFLPFFLCCLFVFCAMIHSLSCTHMFTCSVCAISLYSVTTLVLICLLIRSFNQQPLSPTAVSPSKRVASRSQSPAKSLSKSPKKNVSPAVSPAKSRSQSPRRSPSKSPQSGRVSPAHTPAVSVHSNQPSPP